MSEETSNQIRSPRSLFAQRFTELYEAAGNPTLRRVATAAENRMRAAQGGRAGGASAQRISDWKAGRNVPARFESLLPVVLTLVELARAAGSPLTRQLAEPKEWQRLWHAATTWVPEEATEAACPYLGLSAYRREDRELFFGRARATDELAGMVRAATGIVVVLGASGAGKSSLLSAGLIPALNDWEITAFTPGPHPGEVLPNLAPRTDGPRRLLIIDQFEELFTACDSERERQDLLTAIDTAATRTEDPIAVVMAVRADFYAHCLNYLVLQEALEQRSYLLGPMRIDELAQAVSGPARAVGLELEPGLEELVITELCGAGDHPDRRTYDPGALPLLSHVMAATWQHREGRRLTVSGYRKAGGVVGSVADTAENAWNELTSDQQIAARSILLGLVTVGPDARDTRRRADRADLLSRATGREDAAAALELLSRTRLLALDADTVTLTHEIVLVAWPRLRAWIDEDRVGYLVRQRLETDAAEWAAQDRDSSLLYQGTRLDNALDHVDPPPVGRLAAEFLTTAAAARTTARRRATWVKARFAFLAAALLIVAFGAYSQNRLADQRRADKDFAAVLAAADHARQTDPSLAAQLNLVAWRMRPGDAEVRSRLLQSQTDALVTVTAAHPASLRAIEYQPGGTVLASLADDHGLRLWDAADARHPKQIGPQLDDIGAVAFGSTTLMATAAQSHPEVTLWDVTTPAEPRRLATVPSPPGTSGIRMTLAPGGRTLAVDTATQLMMWDVTDPRAPVLSSARPLHADNSVGAPGYLEFSPDGRLLVRADGDRRTSSNSVQLWDVRNPAAPTLAVPSLGTPSPLEHSLAFSPDSTILAIGDSESDAPPSRPRVQLWDVRDAGHPNVLSSLEPNSSMLRALAFSPQGDILAVSGNRGAEVWNVTVTAAPTRLTDKLSTNPSLCHFGGLDSPCNSGPSTIAFAPDGHEMTAGGFSGDLQVWSLPTAVLPRQWGSEPQTAFAANGARMAIGYAGGRVQLWDIRNPQVPKRIGEYDGDDKLSYPALSPDGNTLQVLGSSPARVVTVDISDPAHPRPRSDWTVPTTETGTISTMSSDHRIMITEDDRGAFQLWDLTDPALPRRVGAALPMTAYQGIPLLSDDGKVLVFRERISKGDNVQTVATLWDLTDPARPQRVSELLRQSWNAITAIAISSDRRTMVTTNNETMRIWDISTPNRPAELSADITAHTVPIQPFSFAADSRAVFTVALDGTLQRWDIDDRGHPELATFLQQSGRYAGNAALAPDGQHVVSGSSDGTIHLWDLDVQHAVDRVCAVTGNMWTEDLWHRYLPQLRYAPPCH
ncbi:WD40 repeat domain-containing protein [Nocardia sp. CDC160]|uniref:WD40 repeat domain-containing protein n=1 Tax=Nocardia sp. CDC160 TaxID=3112166 RepID=UPI002DB7F98A|nr:WD40 repeat domain-containing protein [Nocardia sp. CDC160]MEC3913188.1 WD40 repeat domain-containing protein [Nocardia sp. CDC160]